MLHLGPQWIFVPVKENIETIALAKMFIRHYFLSAISCGYRRKLGKGNALHIQLYLVNYKLGLKISLIF